MINIKVDYEDKIINDNFLSPQDFETIRNVITDGEFPWFYGTYSSDDKQSFPLDHKSPHIGFFYHMIYEKNVPCSPFYNYFSNILEQLNATILFRIRVNLTPGLPEPQFADFHSDTSDILQEDIAGEWTTSILYINTNNGYTEFEDGTKVESVANRLVIFPSNIKHRMVSQTDEEPRILINFNYLRSKNQFLFEEEL